MLVRAVGRGEVCVAQPPPSITEVGRPAKPGASLPSQPLFLLSILNSLSTPAVQILPPHGTGNAKLLGREDGTVSPLDFSSQEPNFNVLSSGLGDRAGPLVAALGSPGRRGHLRLLGPSDIFPSESLAAHGKKQAQGGWEKPTEAAGFRTRKSGLPQ